MLRGALVAALLTAAAAMAHAEVWMVKSGGRLGCRERQTLVDLAAAPPAATAKPAPNGCIVFFSGERLLEQPEPGSGFNEHLKVEREDGSLLYVRSADVVPDPGIGSIEEDRAEP